MVLTNTTEYALRILAFMVRDPEQKYSAKYLVDELKISDNYLRRIMTDLTKAGFIKSIQGRDGGYVFNRNLNEISLMDIIDATEDINKHVSCVLGFSLCSEADPCALHNTFKQLRADFMDIVKNKNLSNIDFTQVNKF
jgi:Rrf2 family protein